MLRPGGRERVDIFGGGCIDGIGGFGSFGLTAHSGSAPAPVETARFASGAVVALPLPPDLELFYVIRALSIAASCSTWPSSAWWRSYRHGAPRWHAEMVSRTH